MLCLSHVLDLTRRSWNVPVTLKEMDCKRPWLARGFILAWISKSNLDYTTFNTIQCWGYPPSLTQMDRFHRRCLKPRHWVNKCSPKHHSSHCWTIGTSCLLSFSCLFGHTTFLLDHIVHLKKKKKNLNYPKKQTQKWCRSTGGVDEKWFDLLSTWSSGFME